MPKDLKEWLNKTLQEIMVLDYKIEQKTQTEATIKQQMILQKMLLKDGAKKVFVMLQEDTH